MWKTHRIEIETEPWEELEKGKQAACLMIAALQRRTHDWLSDLWGIQQS